MEGFTIRTTRHSEIIDITPDVEKIVAKSGIKNGICIVYVPHTTAAVTINENADPSVKVDILNYLNKIVPWNGNYTHLEGNAAAHIKSAVIGSSRTIIINNGRLVLGTWQGIYFCEFDGPRHRNVFVEIIEKVEA
jgi:secondary thiamine-phosphate synthase enzyme